jgi:hypothetical protein
LFEAERRWVQAIIHTCGSALTSYFFNLYRHFTDQLMGLNNNTESIIIMGKNKIQYNIILLQDAIERRDYPAG